MSSILASTTAPLQAGITATPPTGGGSSIASPHPDYLARHPDYVTMFDTNEGQRHIKSKTTGYLSATSGMRALSNSSTSLDGEGAELYAAYLNRAFFPDLVKETVRALAGILDREPANIELPPALEDMRKLATPKGESLNQLLVQIHVYQLLYGRVGLLLDVDPGRDLPLIVCYPGPQIINWDDATQTGNDRQQNDDQRREAVRRLLLVVLNESRFERDTGDRFTWNNVPRYRALDLATGNFQSQVERDGVMQEAIEPSIRGKKFDEIPFVFVNSSDMATKPGDVPLINLANLALAIYRGEADHRSALFMAGQDTLVITGYNIEDDSDPDGNPSSDSKPIIGSGAYINIPDSDGDAKFIGPESQALSEQRTSLGDDYTRAGEEGIKLLSTGAGAEAAETLRIRVAARTATLQTIAMTSAAALEESLKMAATWIGANPDEVKVEPNLDFIDESTDPADLVKYAQAKKAGTPLSWKSVHNMLRQKDFTEMTFEEELEQMAEEDDNPQLSGGDSDLNGQAGVDEFGQPLPGQPLPGQPLPGQGSDEDEDGGSDED